MNGGYFYKEKLLLFARTVLFDTVFLSSEFFSFNSYVYYLTRGFIASTRAFNLLTRTFNFATRGFSLLTHAFELVTRGFETVTHNS